MLILQPSQLADKNFNSLILLFPDLYVLLEWQLHGLLDVLLYLFAAPALLVRMLGQTLDGAPEGSRRIGLNSDSSYTGLK